MTPVFQGALLPLNLLAKHTRERTLLNAVLLSHSLLALSIQAAGIGSSGLFWLSGAPILAGLILEKLLTASHYDDVWLGTYVLGQLIPISFGTELFTATADFFVPLVSVFLCHKQHPNIHHTLRLAEWEL
jgi:hypothetical protein